MAKKTIRYLVTLNPDNTIQSFYIIRDEKENKFLLESLGSILFEIVATGTFRTFDPDDDIHVKDFFEYDKEELGKYHIFDFQMSALGFICRRLIEEKGPAYELYPEEIEERCLISDNTRNTNLNLIDISGGDKK